ncbi:transposable element Tcb1 transposase [Trichonephila clavipes]|nr:transposable element Tcb1 transposase [Trichonephila clavipes]
MQRLWQDLPQGVISDLIESMPRRISACIAAREKWNVCNSSIVRLPLTGNQRCLRCQWCDVQRRWRTEWNDIVFTDESYFCLQNHDGSIRVQRHRDKRLINFCFMHRHIGPATGSKVWDGMRFPRHTLLVRIAGTLNSWSYISEILNLNDPPIHPMLVINHIPTELCLTTSGHAMLKISSLPTRLNCFLCLLVFPIYRQSKTCGPSMHSDWAKIHHPLPHQINFDNM